MPGMKWSNRCRSDPQIAQLVSIKNLLLAALPRNVFEALQPDFVHVELESRTPIYRPEDEVEWVYFPSTGMISILQATPDSRGIELATIGKECALGAIAGFGLNYALTAAVVQMPLTALKISAIRFRKHVAQFASLQEMALKSNEVILAQTQDHRGLQCAPQCRTAVLSMVAPDLGSFGSRQYFADAGISGRDAGCTKNVGYRDRVQTAG